MKSFTRPPHRLTSSRLGSGDGAFECRSVNGGRFRFAMSHRRRSTGVREPSQFLDGRQTRSNPIPSCLPVNRELRPYAYLEIALCSQITWSVRQRVYAALKTIWFFAGTSGHRNLVHSENNRTRINRSDRQGDLSGNSRPQRDHEESRIPIRHNRTSVD